MRAIERQFGGYVAAVVLGAVVTFPLWLFRGSLTLGNISLVYVLAILAIAIRLGMGPSLLAAVASFFASEFFLLEPLYSFKVADPREYLDLCIYLIVATLAGQFGAYARRQAQEAHRRAAEQELLYSLSTSLNRVAEREHV